MDKAGCRADYSGFYSAVSNYLPEVNAFNLNSSCHCEGEKEKKKLWQVCPLRVGHDLVDINNFGGDKCY